MYTVRKADRYEDGWAQTVLKLEILYAVGCILVSERHNYLTVVAVITV